MTGAAIPPPARPASPSAAAANSPAASKVNTLRIHIVAEKLAMYAHSTQAIDVPFFFNLCISLARGLDYAIANNEIPAQVLELPRIFKQICRGAKEDTLQAALMVLLISLKNACKARWFPSKDTQELLALVDEVGKNFCTPEGFNCEQTNVTPIVSRIVSRYYPCIRLGHILASVDIKPGFEACVVDFHISKNITYSATEKIRMMVATRDNMDTSSCIITPQKANFLLNGKSVQGRSAGCMDPGPQSPTAVNHMLKYGTNLLQAIGNFDAHYVVLIAFMSAVPSTDLPVPDDYVQPTIDAVNADAEIVEGSSRISLNCPISFARIRIPAKGRTCRHLQCFDLSNYIEINSKRPSWRCPLCNQTVCFLDTRIDQNMTKILKKVPKEVSDVIIRSDGSWEIARGSDNHKHELHPKASEGPPDGLDQQPAPHLSNIYDLTEEDEDMTPVDVRVHEERKPEGASHLGHSGTVSVPADHKTRADSNPVGGTSANILGHSTPAANREQRAIMGTNQQSSSRTLVQTPSTNSLQQSQNARTISSPRGYATPNSASRTPNSASRTPTAILGHPRMHAPSSRVTSSSVPVSASSSPGDAARQRQVPQSARQPYAPQASEPRKQFNAPLYMEPPPSARLPLPHVRAGVGIRFTEEELRTIRENARRERERATLPSLPTRIQTSTPPSAPKPRSVDGTRSVSAEPAPASGSRGAAQDAQPDQSWKPTGRMRGSLAGKAADALSEMIIRPTQTTPTPPAESSNRDDDLSDPLRALLAKRNSAPWSNAPQK